MKKFVAIITNWQSNGVRVETIEGEDIVDANENAEFHNADHALIIKASEVAPLIIKLNNIKKKL